MLDTLVSRIAGLFEKEFLLGSLLPSLLFATAVGVTLAGVLGAEASVAMLEELSGMRQVGLVTLASLMLLTAAYLLNALRSTLTRFWSGRTNFPFYLLWGWVRMGENYHVSRFKDLRTRSRKISPWMDVVNYLKVEVRARWKTGVIDPGLEGEILASVQSLEANLTQEEVRDRLLPLIDAFDDYPGEALTMHYSEAKSLLMTFHDQADTASTKTRWMESISMLCREAKRRWKHGAPDASRLVKLRKALRALDRQMTPDEARKQLQPIIDAYNTFPGESLTSIYEEAKTRLTDLHEGERAYRADLEFLLDRQYGTLQSVRATALGNSIESYNQYPAKRYKMAAEFFWPRLMQVMKPESRSLLQDAQTLLDFSVTLASLAAIYGIAALLGGPWLWYQPGLWLSLAGIGFATSYLFYSLAVTTARQVGELVRSAFDLYRLDLLAALRLPEPASLVAEQAEWDGFSRWSLFGTGSDFQIQPRKLDA